MRIVFYVAVLVLGILSMGFQLLASRLLNPHFGSSIIVWAWLIATFLAAFSVGSLVGGWISNCESTARIRLQTITAIVAVVTLSATAAGGSSWLDWVELHFESVQIGLLIACATLFFLPVVALSIFGPLNVQWLAARGVAPGKASGLIYGVSTLGNIAGVMLTAFALIPHFRVSTLLHLWLVVAGVGLTALLQLLRKGGA